MPLLLAGGVCCCAVDVGLAGVEDADELLDGTGIAVGVGLVVAAGDAELLRLDGAAGAGEVAGVELGAGVLAAEVSAVADFLERDFFGAPVSAALVSALSAASADFFLAEVEDSAAAELSAESADFLDRLFFLAVASASVEAAVASAESALLFFEPLFLVPLSAAELSAVELPAASADFFDPLFFDVDLPLSATALSAESALALFLERFFLVVESAVADLSGLSELFFFELDFVLLLESATESLVVCEESSGLAFFLDFFELAELSL
jgi:hypothetical protein